jgi:hypothetical protein
VYGPLQVIALARSNIASASSKWKGQVARSLGVSNGTVGTTVLRARAAGLDWSQVQGLTDEALETRLYGRPEVVGQRQRPWPDCAYLHAERRKAGVTQSRFGVNPNVESRCS